MKVTEETMQKCLRRSAELLYSEDKMTVGQLQAKLIAEFGQATFIAVRKEIEESASG